MEEFTIQEAMIELKKIAENEFRGEALSGLAVDDEVVCRRVRCKNLISLGCTSVDAADSGEAAIEFIKSGNYHFVFCDFNLSKEPTKKNGAEVVCALKKLENAEKTLVLCVTSQVDQMRREIISGLEQMGKLHLLSTIRFANKSTELVEQRRKLSLPANLTESSNEGDKSSENNKSPLPRRATFPGV